MKQILKYLLSKFTVEELIDFILSVLADYLKKKAKTISYHDRQALENIQEKATGIYTALNDLKKGTEGWPTV